MAHVTDGHEPLRARRPGRCWRNAGRTAVALGFDDSRERWRLLATADAGDLAAADAHLNAALKEWTRET